MSSDEELTCPICTEQMELISYGICNHRICHLCCLRLRALYKTNNCPLCKTELNRIAVVKEFNDNLVYENLSLDNWPRDALLSVYCESQQVLDILLTILRFNCPDTQCDESVNSWKQLIAHVKDKHGKQLCSICIKYKKVFAHEHQLLSRKELEKHCMEGDKDDPSFKGHPECKFCSSYFYSSDELFTHCREKHEECHLCRKAGFLNQYYRDYKELENHFRTDHYYCEEPACKEKTFVVFDSSIDFKAHMVKEHGGQMSKYEKKQNMKVNLGEFHRPESSSGSSRNEPRFKKPPGFGGSLTHDRSSTETNEITPTSSSTPQPFYESEFPSMSKAPQHPTIQAEEIFFRDMLEKKILETISNTGELERDLVSGISPLIKNDPKKFRAICSHCTNYLAGYTLPEKLADHLETILGVQGYHSIFNRLIKIFPENRQSGLLGVFNDKKAKSTHFPELRASDPVTTKSNLLVVKSHSKGKYNSFRTAGEDEWNHGVVNSDPIVISEQDFPSLKSSNPTKDVVFTEKKGKSKKKQILFSNSLPANPSTTININNTTSSNSTNNNLNNSDTLAKVERMKIGNSTHEDSPRVVPVDTSNSSRGPRFSSKDFPSLPKSEGKPIVWKPILEDKKSIKNEWNSETEDNDVVEESNGSKKKSKKKKMMIITSLLKQLAKKLKSKINFIKMMKIYYNSLKRTQTKSTVVNPRVEFLLEKLPDTSINFNMIKFLHFLSKESDKEEESLFKNNPTALVLSKEDEEFFQTIHKTQNNSLQLSCIRSYRNKINKNQQLPKRVCFMLTEKYDFNALFEFYTIASGKQLNIVSFESFLEYSFEYIELIYNNSQIQLGNTRLDLFSLEASTKIFKRLKNLLMILQSVIVDDLCTLELKDYCRRLINGHNLYYDYYLILDKLLIVHDLVKSDSVERLKEFYEIIIAYSSLDCSEMTLIEDYCLYRTVQSYFNQLGQFFLFESVDRNALISELERRNELISSDISRLQLQRPQQPIKQQQLPFKPISAPVSVSSIKYDVLNIENTGVKHSPSDSTNVTSTEQNDSFSFISDLALIKEEEERIKSEMAAKQFLLYQKELRQSFVLKRLKRVSKLKDLYTSSSA